MDKENIVISDWSPAALHLDRNKRALERWPLEWKGRTQEAGNEESGAVCLLALVLHISSQNLTKSITPSRCLAHYELG